MIEKVKDHIKKHKVAYSCGATIVVTAGITCLIMKGRCAGLQSGSDGPAKVTTRPFFLFSDHNNVVSVIAREGRGHPGYLVKCLETGVIFLSQGDAARDMGISPSAISSQLNGSFDNANGYHFERVPA